MIIRQARETDAAAIAEIANWVIRDTLSTFTTVEKKSAAIEQDIIAKGARFLVAEEAGKLFGYAYYGPFRAGPGYAHTAEHTVHLHPTVQGRGIGRALMGELEQCARADDVHVLVAGVSGANPAGIAFHAALGFVEVGRMPEVGRKGGQWLDMVLMQKILPGKGKPDPDSADKGR